MTSRFVFYLISILCFVALWGCSSQESVKAALDKDPSIIYKAMEKDPEGFAMAMQRISDAHRALMERKAAEARTQELSDDLRSPKKPEIGSDRALLGKKDAEIFVVAYTDFQCPYCQRGYNTIEEFRKKYGGRVGYMVKHLPLDFHAHAMPAALRFEAIALQSPTKAYKFHNLVFENQRELNARGEDFLDQQARKAGADMARMKRDMGGEKVQARIAADMAEAKAFGISGTPGFVVNGVALKGAYPISAFEEIVARTTKATN